jgi:antitoxin HicB
VNRRTTKKPFDHSGSSFDSFLEEEGIREEAETVAIKRVLAWQLEQAMREQRKTKQAMSKELHTSRSQLNRLLDPQNVSVSLETITRAARVLGKRVTIRITDARESRTRPRRAVQRATAPQGVRATRPVTGAV